MRVIKKENFECDAFNSPSFADLAHTISLGSESRKKVVEGTGIALNVTIAVNVTRITTPSILCRSFITMGNIVTF